MTPQDFVYWLNGFVELGGNKNPPDAAQWKMICEHLKLTTIKVTPKLDVTPPVTIPTINPTPYIPTPNVNPWYDWGQGTGQPPLIKC